MAGGSYSAKVMAETGARNARKNRAVHCIEGEYVTNSQIAERVGCTLAQTTFRMTRARRLPGPVTWERLRK
jgi:hypothetical protein